ncbi:MAG: O-Antigen ligase [Pelotomaculum sp. PtaB.Bin104]|nr:MAG: O-Antigen ligase [Pelotomaculum sp. PtaB.Bin104]
MPKVIAKGKKKAVMVKTPESDQWGIVHTIAFWGLAILLFLPPYFRGLFFQPEQERALILAAVIFWFAWLWKWSKRDKEFLSHPLDFFILAFPVVYIISAFQAANYGLAVDEVVKTTLYFLVYWLVSRLLKDEKDVVTLLHVLYISAIGVALAGLATATGITHIKDGFLNGRIYSSFQYPNALASYLAAVMFIGFYLWRRAGLPALGGLAAGATIKGVTSWLNFDSLNQYLYAAGNFLLLAVLLGTKSNGGFLVFFIVLILFIIGLPKGNKIPVIIHFILIGIPSFLAIWRFLTAVAGDKMDLAWLWVFVGLALALAGQKLYVLGENRRLVDWINNHRVQLIIGAIISIVLAGILVYVILSGNAELFEKIKTYHFRLRDVTERFYFFNDAIRMIRDRPLLGWAGGGWQEAYRSYQSYLYDSNQVHSYYLQVGVETGILGIVVVLGIWASFLLAAHRAFHGQQNEGHRLLVWIITIAALSIGLHAVIDFDLSLSALFLVLCSLFGMVRSIEKMMRQSGESLKRSKSYIPPNNAILIGASVLSVLIVFFAGSLAMAGNYASQAGKYIQAQNFNKGSEYLQKAISDNPFKADYHSNLVLVYQRQGKYEEGLAEAQKAIDKSKYSALRYADMASLFINTKKSAESITYAGKAVQLAPYQVQWYEFMTRAYFIAGINELIAGNKDMSRQYFDNLLQVPVTIEEKMAGLNEVQKRLWNVAPYMTSTPAISLNVGIAQYFLGDWQSAETNLQKAGGDDNTKGEALLWLSILRGKQGKDAEAKELSEQALTLVPQYKEQYQGLSQLPLIK